MQLPDHLTFVDIETTGMSAQYSRIIEIGLVKVDFGKVTKTYETLFNPYQHIDPFVERLTGISTEDLIHAPLFHEKCDELLPFFEDTVFVAHNARFDYSFLKEEFLKIGVDFHPKKLCTVQLARILYPGWKRYSLDSVIAWGGFQCENRHRAFSDAYVLWDFYQKALEDHGEKIVVDAIERIIGAPSIPPHLKDIIKSLPESPGVYFFYGADGSPLYIGKSINIKERVLSHFAASTRITTDIKLSSSVFSIECEKTPGELTALLLESRRIKELQPIHNKKLRQTRQLTVIRESTDEHGYKKAQVELVTGTLDSTEDVLRICKSKRQAQTFLSTVAEEHTLCPKLLGLEKRSGSCFAFHLEKCHGACVNKEPPAAYNLRFLEAFLSYKLKRWPFSGPVLIHEGQETWEEYLLIDQWCFLGSVSNEDELWERNEDSYEFDYDTYKLLTSFLLNPKNKKKIQVLTEKKKPSYASDDIYLSV